MSLVVNGVIHEVGSAQYANGVELDRIVANGVEVWRAFYASWSGDSTVVTDYSFVYMGIETSGALHRMVNNSAVGAWITSANSLGAGVSRVQYGFTTNDMVLTTTASTLFFNVETYTTIGTISFSVTSGFSGSSIAATSTGFQTSAGQLRFYSGEQYGDWITLT